MLHRPSDSASWGVGGPGAARIGIGGPVGSGKTALIERLIPVLSARGVDLAVVTNDLVTREDAERLRRSGLIYPARVSAVEAGGRTHTPIPLGTALDSSPVTHLDRMSPSAWMILFASGSGSLAADLSLP